MAPKCSKSVGWLENNENNIWSNIMGCGKEMLQKTFVQMVHLWAQKSIIQAIWVQNNERLNDICHTIELLSHLVHYSFYDIYNIHCKKWTLYPAKNNNFPYRKFGRHK